MVGVFISRHDGAGGRQHGARHRDLAGLGDHRLRRPSSASTSLGMVLAGTVVLALQRALWLRLMARTERLFGLRSSGVPAQVAARVVGAEAEPLVEPARRVVVDLARAATPWSRPARRPTPAAPPAPRAQALAAVLRGRPRGRAARASRRPAPPPRWRRRRRSRPDPPATARCNAVSDAEGVVRGTQRRGHRVTAAEGPRRGRPAGSPRRPPGTASQPAAESAPRPRSRHSTWASDRAVAGGVEAPGPASRPRRGPGRGRRSPGRSSRA